MSIYFQDLRNEDMSLRPERSAGKQSHKFWRLRRYRS